MAYEFSLGFYLEEGYSCRPRHYMREQLRSTAPDLCQILERHYDSCCLETLGSTQGPVRICKCPWPFQLRGTVVSCQGCEKRIGNLRQMAPALAEKLPKSEVEEIGLVGFGNFGKFFGGRLALDFNVTAYDVRNCQTEAEALGVAWGTLEQVAAKDLVILAVPLGGVASVLEKLVCCVQPDTLVMDVCSTKLEPIQLMQKYLPRAEILGTHPLFGPQSVGKNYSRFSVSIKLSDKFLVLQSRHKIAVCPVQNNSAKTEFLSSFFRKVGLEVVSITPEEHDKQMAPVQALTHFIARALNELRVAESEVATKAYEHLVKVARLLGSDSWELFQTIENGNPFAAEMRQRFVGKLLELEERLKQG